MGEKLQVLGSLSLHGTVYTIELNKPSSSANDPLEVHIQSHCNRIELSLADSIKLAIAITSAKEKLLRYKKL